jgi:cytochrome c-type biogenesis protein CcmH/NrfG
MLVILFAAMGAIRRQYPQMALLANPQLTTAQQLVSARHALQQRQPDEAIAQLQDVIKAAPQAAEPRYLLGQAYLMQRKPDLAIAALQEALRLDPEYGQAAAGLGAAYQAKGMKAEAEQAFRKAAELGYGGN